MRHYPLKFVVMLALMLMAGCQAAGQTAVAEATVGTVSASNALATTHAELLATSVVEHTETARVPTHTPTLTLTPTFGPSPTPTLTRTLRPTAGPPGRVEDQAWYQEGDVTVYTREGNLCAVLEGGSPVYLADAAWIYRVLVSWNQRTVAFVRSLPREGSGSIELWPDQVDPNQELWAVGIDGRGLRLLHDPETVEDASGVNDVETFHGHQFVQLEWIPGTQSLAYTTGLVDYWVVYSNDLHIVDAVSGAHSMLLNYGSGGGYFEISPDGRQIAYIRSAHVPNDGYPEHRDTIGLINTDGSNWLPSIYTYEPIATYTDYNLFVNLTWRPDSSGFWIAIPPLDPWYSGDTEMTLWYIPADGSAAVQIMQWDPVTRDRSVPVVSPDGRHLAFVGTIGGGEWGLHILSLDAQQDTLYFEPVDDARIAFLRWEPDSTHFVFRASPLSSGYWSSTLFRGGIGEDYEPVPTPEVPPQGCAP